MASKTWSVQANAKEVEEPELLLESVTNAARQRARRAASRVNSKMNRCLIENSDVSESYADVVHVLERINGDDDKFMTSLEWAWGMKRQGLLNLDTNKNILILSPTMRRTFKFGKWTLLPEDSILRQYFDKDMRIHKRQDFPRINDGAYEYTFIPLHSMEDVYIPRQEEDGSVTIHEYPYPNFPVLKSHMHPNFIIVEFGIVLSIIDEDKRTKVLDLHPSLRLMKRLYDEWKSCFTVENHKRAKRAHPKFMTPEYPFTRYRPDIDPNLTPPRRIPMQQTDSLKRRASITDDDSDIDVSFQTPPNKKTKWTMLTERTLWAHDLGIFSVEKWFATRVSSWVNDSVAYPPLPTSPLPRE
ncbi:hypothetical protein CVT24_002355 [Panaeolus cyanescens]|uniref:HNH nuclease domain-containing protein n=1 Tax=Panaeolus cyanescens TaxID=181874 RepID=A0A409W142_9AGAR|nr:hypothetical protein CVT24_002355 [Panaeolus cyanescens]